MKNILKKLSVLILLGFASLPLACGNVEPEPTNKLEAPVITLTDTGVVTWSSVTNADCYKVFLNDELALISKGYSYEIEETAIGNYPIYVIASDSSGVYTDSNKSNLQIYHVTVEQLQTPVLSFDGTSIKWKSIAHADGYEVFANNEKVKNPTIATKGDEQILTISGLDIKKSKVEVKAICNSEQYRNSKLSKSVDYVQTSSRRVWNANQVDNEWDKENTACIQHIIEPEILIWVDVKGSNPAAFENYINIPDDAKSFAITGYRHDPYGACSITLEMKRFGDSEYTNIPYGEQTSAKFTDPSQATYYWELPEGFRSGSVYTKITIESSGAYQARFVLRYLSFETVTEPTDPILPIDQGVTLTSLTNGKMIKFNTEKGYGTYADEDDQPSDVAIKFVNDTVNGEGYYRMMTQNGLYLTFARFLNDLDGVADFLVECEYNAELNAQVWMAKPISSIGGIDVFTFQNYGMPDGTDDQGNPLYLVLDIPYGGCDNTSSWHDIDNTDLQFIVNKADATFPTSGEHTPSKNLDLSKEVIVSFAGRNSTLELNNDGRYYNTNKLLNNVTDLTPYAWKFEKVSGDYYRIKNSNDKYLKVISETGKYHVIEDDYADNNSSFLWKLRSKTGMFFELVNKFVNEDSGFSQYLVMDVDSKLAFYTDLFNHGDQIVRIRNI